MYNNFNQCYLPGCSPFAPVPMGAVSPTVSLLTLPASAVFPGCSRLIAFYGFRAKPFTPIRGSVRSFVAAAIAARNNVALRRFPLALVPTPLSFSAPTISSASSALSVSLSPSCWGSVLMLSSPAFVRAVLSGVCPVSLALASFPRWCLRSSLLGALCAAGRAGVFHSTDFIPVIRSFLSVALPSLGLSPSASPAVIIHGLSSFRMVRAVHVLLALRGLALLRLSSMFPLSVLLFPVPVFHLALLLCPVVVMVAPLRVALYLLLCVYGFYAKGG